MQSALKTKVTFEFVVLNANTLMRQIPNFLFLISFSSITWGATASLECKFNLEASQNGLVKQSQPFELRFVRDLQKKTTYLMGNSGSAEVKAIENNDAVSYVEVTTSGNVMVTTITNSGDAVHSRNTVMQSKLIPSQYYGKCSVK